MSFLDSSRSTYGWIKSESIWSCILPAELGATRPGWPMGGKLPSNVWMLRGRAFEWRLPGRDGPNLRTGFYPAQSGAQRQSSRKFGCQCASWPPTAVSPCQSQVVLQQGISSDIPKKVAHFPVVSPNAQGLIDGSGAIGVRPCWGAFAPGMLWRRQRPVATLAWLVG